MKLRLLLIPAILLFAVPEAHAGKPPKKAIEKILGIADEVTIPKPPGRVPVPSKSPGGAGSGATAGPGKNPGFLDNLEDLEVKPTKPPAALKPYELEGASGAGGTNRVEFSVGDLPNDKGRATGNNLAVVSGGKIAIGLDDRPFTAELGDLRFTHDGIDSKFSDGRTLWELVNNLLTDPDYINQVSPLRVVEINGKLFSLDNRRLAALTLAGIEHPPVRWATPEEVADDLIWRFSTVSEGMWVKIRDGAEVVIPVP